MTAGETWAGEVTSRSCFFRSCKIGTIAGGSFLYIAGIDARRRSMHIVTITHPILKSTERDPEKTSSQFMPHYRV